METTTARLLNACVVEPSGCWRWTKYLNSNGYGAMSFNGKKTAAYRVSYEAFVGPIPSGLELDHLCRNRACINPKHLEPVTRRENVVRGISCIAKNARKTHCPAGHLLGPQKLAEGRLRRRCEVCQRAAVKRYREKCRANTNQFSA